MHTGDLVANGGDTSLWPIFFDVERELLRNVAFYPSLGNHERNAGNYYDFLGGRPYYSFDWGSAHFAVINSDIGTPPPASLRRTPSGRSRPAGSKPTWRSPKRRFPLRRRAPSAR